ncbi:poly-beta-1,6 N-acetyl-D-glucosamine export porin PgaA [Comamonadaceae bacterium OH2310_COT-174]|nr:poly-beta-1,6 N-acetyl-D-glucosamine export porin PgaA [Comamonadaceae bacterium OH2310_COT-174]
MAPPTSHHRPEHPWQQPPRCATCLPMSPRTPLPTSRLLRCLATAAALGCATAPALADAHYDRLIHQARAGQTAPALAHFAAQAQDSLSARHVNDWIVISGWAGQDQQTLAIYQQHRQRVRLEPASLAAVGRAYRNLKHWDMAASLLDAAIQRDPEHSDWYLTAAYALAEGGHAAQASAQLDAFEQRFAQQRLPLLLARSYVARITQQPYDALQYASAAIDLAPDNAQAQNHYLHALRAAGMAERALQYLAAARPAEADAALVRSLQADYGAELVRIGEAASGTQAEDQARKRRTLDYYAQLLAQWQQALQASAPGSAEHQALQRDIRRVRTDRLVALWQARQAQALLDEYAALRAQDPELPDYALMQVGAALLETRQPEEALRIYDGIAERWVATAGANAGPQPQGLYTGRLYARVETEQLNAARALARQHLAQTSPERRIPGNPNPLPNTDWSATRRDQAAAELYAGRLPQAQAQFEELMALGPGDSHTHMGLVSTYRNRGWPRRAAEELKIIQHTSGDGHELGLLLEQAGVAQELQDWSTAQALLEHAQQRYPEEPRVQRAQRQWQVARMPMVQFNAEYRDSDSPTAIGEGATRYALLGYSAPLHERWRLFAAARHSSGNYLEGKGRYHQLAAGAQWHWRDTQAEFELSALRAAQRTHTGLRLAARHDLSDHWQLQARAARNSIETPLRALRAGITADELALGLQWRAHESTRLGLTAEAMDFSDGNRRTSYFIDGQQRLFTAAHLQLDAGLELSHSRNTRPGQGPYFAPQRDWSILPGLTAYHILHRRYEQVWRHELHLAAGRYSQHGFGSGGYQRLRYGQQWKWNDTTSLDWNTGLSWRPYDGVRERALYFNIGFSHRF